MLCAVVVSLLKGERHSDTRTARPSYARCAAVCLLTVPLMHACAVGMMCLTGGVDMRAAIAAVSLPFIPGDIAKAFLSAALGKAIARLPR